LITIRDLLNRIRWDKTFGEGNFVIGYYDRLDDCIVRVPLRELSFEADNHFSFDLLDHDGVLHSIPLHRITEVYKNGELIWHREH
jgi:uncharacterized protein (UPF0248 family)